MGCAPARAPALDRDAGTGEKKGGLRYQAPIRIWLMTRHDETRASQREDTMSRASTQEPGKGGPGRAGTTSRPPHWRRASQGCHACGAGIRLTSSDTGGAARGGRRWRGGGGAISVFPLRESRHFASEVPSGTAQLRGSERVIRRRRGVTHAMASQFWRAACWRRIFHHLSKPLDRPCLWPVPVPEP